MRIFLKNLFLPFSIAGAFCAIFYPGLLSADSVLQLEQARSWTFKADHPVLMAFVWYFLDKAIPGPFGMLVFHLLCWVFGIWILARKIFQKFSHQLLFLILLSFYPPIFFQLGVIWKDIGMMNCLILAFALVYEEKKIGPLKSVLICLLIFYATSVRHNAILAALPLIYFFASKITQGNVKKILETVLLTAIFIFSNQVMTKILVKERENYYKSVQAIYDLAGISVYSEKLILPKFLTNLEPPLNLDELKTLYNPETIIDLYCCTLSPRFLRAAQSKKEEKETMQLFFEAIKTEPLAYLKHRYQVFRRLLGLSSKVHKPIQTNTHPNNFGIKEPSNKVFQSYLNFAQKIQNSTIFRPWFYVLILLAVFANTIRKQGFKESYNLSNPKIVLFYSGLIYLAGYFFLAPAADFRYTIWTICCSLLATTHLALIKQLKTPH